MDMQQALPTAYTGDLTAVITNSAKLYEGDLTHYFQVIFHQAQNLHLPYHNFRHMMHVTWLTHQGCVFHRDEMTPREMRNTLVAALMHDFDHSGMRGNDDLNIMRAHRAVNAHHADIDIPYVVDIFDLISATEYPYKVPVEKLSLGAQILRDADAAQAFSVAWIQQVVFGLAAEWNMKPLEVLRAQTPFLNELRFLSRWARVTFPQSAIDAKIAETKALHSLIVSM